MLNTECAISIHMRQLNVPLEYTLYTLCDLNKDLRFILCTHCDTGALSLHYTLCFMTAVYPCQYCL